MHSPDFYKILNPLRGLSQVSQWGRGEKNVFEVYKRGESEISPTLGVDWGAKKIKDPPPFNTSALGKQQDLGEGCGRRQWVTWRCWTPGPWVLAS